MHQRAAPNVSARVESVSRWVCRCQDPPVLLATYDRAGRINIKVRDRYWHVVGMVATHCPRCGAEHVLDLRPTTSTPTDPSDRS
jgi:hypothetical protein